MGTLQGLSLPYSCKPANSKNYGGKRSIGNIKYIVLHYTANNGDTDTGNGNYFANNIVGASAHYFVDEDSCTQAVPDDYIAWHCETRGMALKCACRNANSLGVEMCSDKVNGVYVITQKTKENAAILVKYLMKKYNVPASNVIRHYDICGKLCPEPWVRVPSEWQSFKAMLTEAATNKEDLEVVTKTPIIINGSKHTIDRIFKDGKNYICLSDLKGKGFNVGYDAKSKIPSLNNTIYKLPLIIDGKLTSVEAVNIGGYNYVPIRSIVRALEDMEIEYTDKTVVLTRIH